jgi:site-specific recombinase XerD
MRLSLGDLTFLDSDSEPVLEVTSTAPKIPVNRLKTLCKAWIRDGIIAGHTDQSMKGRVHRIEKFFWYLKHSKTDEVGVEELKNFILYLQTGHETPEGRWGNTDDARCKRPMSQIMVGNYHRILKAFFNWMLEQQHIKHDYMRLVKVKRAHKEKKPPISIDDLEKMFRATKLSKYAKRDEAALRLLLDTGLRASEWCGIKRSDYDEDNFCIRVLGKGKKPRTVPLSPKTLKALDAYLRKEKRYDHEPLFRSEKGGALTYAGLYQIIERTAKMAGVKNPGCHSWRRSFVVYMRRGGADLVAIQDLVGHETIDQTAWYAKDEKHSFDVHRRCSPGSTLPI